MLKLVCLCCVLSCFFNCQSQDRRTKEQQEAGYPEPIFWDDSEEKHILDSIAAPKLVADTIEFRKNLIKALHFVDTRPRKKYGYCQVVLDIDTAGLISFSDITNALANESQMQKHVEAIVQLLKFEAAYILKKPDQKIRSFARLNIIVEEDFIRFLLTGVGGVKYFETYLQRPIK